MTSSRMKKTMMASLLLAIMLCTAPAELIFAQPAEQNVTANLVIQVQELQDEVRTLRGQLEEQQQELSNLKQRQRDQYLDLDQRISERRSALPTSSSTSSAGQPASSTNRQVSTAPAEDLPEVRAPMEAPSQTVGLDQPQVQSQSVAASPEAEKAAYDKAFQALKELRYADAADEFQSFLNTYPNSDYADNAQYWLGESYYVTRNYDIALTSFQGLMDRYPDSPKVPDALLKMGYTHYELKQWDASRAALTQVQESYPDTTLARLAESRLRSMRMEGHY
jgi:tol-pal system protein YbgF